ncbi:MAG: hypothetical protein KA953_00520 [Lachnospiraceae bacterium]|nr:hypothetical protein [Lachnospiraceae bacterium]
MEGKLLSDTFHNKEDTQKRDKLSPSKLFEEVCPYYMSIGVSYHDFWDGEFDICKYARKADEINQGNKNREQWWQAVYIFRMMLDASPAFNAFNSGDTNITLSVDRPFPITQKEIDENNRRLAKEQMEQSIQRTKEYIALQNIKSKEEKEKNKKDEVKTDVSKETPKSSYQQTKLDIDENSNKE